MTEWLFVILWVVVALHDALHEAFVATKTEAHHE